MRLCPFCDEVGIVASNDSHVVLKIRMRDEVSHGGQLISSTLQGRLILRRLPRRLFTIQQRSTSIVFHECIEPHQRNNPPVLGTCLLSPECGGGTDTWTVKTMVPFEFHFDRPEFVQGPWIDDCTFPRQSVRAKHRLAMAHERCPLRRLKRYADLNSNIPKQIGRLGRRVLGQ